MTKYQAVLQGVWRYEAGVKRDCIGFPLQELYCLAVQWLIRLGTSKEGVLTNLEHSSSWETSFKSPLLVPILSQMNPMHTCLTSRIFIDILPSTRGSSVWSLSFMFPHQNSICISPLPHTRYMHRPSHSSRFDHPNNIWWAVQIIKLSLCSFLHSPVTSSILDPNILLNTLFSNPLSLRSSLSVSGQVSHPYKTTGKIIVLYSVYVPALVAARSEE